MLENKGLFLEIPRNRDVFDNKVYLGFKQGDITVIGKASVSGFTVQCQCGTFTCRERVELNGKPDDACLDCIKHRLETNNQIVEV